MTKQIPLTQDKVALVDDEDYEWLNQWKWYVGWEKRGFYAGRHSPTINGKRHSIHMHREILGLKYKDGKFGDHINRNTLDNRRHNLRIVSALVNSQNHNKYKHNTSGHNGVYWSKSNKKWRAYININNKSIQLGHFNNIEDAVEARRLGEAEHWDKQKPATFELATERQRPGGE